MTLPFEEFLDVMLLVSVGALSELLVSLLSLFVCFFAVTELRDDADAGLYVDFLFSLTIGREAQIVGLNEPIAWF